MLSQFETSSLLETQFEYLASIDLLQDLVKPWSPEVPI